MSRRAMGVVALMACSLSVATCGSSAKRATSSTTSTTVAGVPSTSVSSGSSAAITVTSPVLREGQPIPVRYTCSGDGVSPPLAWSGVPTGAGAVAVVVDDPDAPSGTFVHWVLPDLPATQTSLPEGGTGFKPPCPPPGPAHHYRFSVYALTKAGPGTPSEIRAAAVASGTLTATFRR